MYKIFLPDVMLFDELYPSTYEHGKAGGKVRVIKAKRDNKGRFTKLKKKSKYGMMKETFLLAQSGTNLIHFQQGITLELSCHNVNLWS